MFGRNPDAIFALHPVRDKEEGGEVVKGAYVVGAYVVKSEIRYFPSPDDFGIRLDPNSLIFHRDITINPANVAGKAGRPRKGHIGQVLVILEERPCTFKQWKDHAREAYGMNDRRMTVFRDEAMEKAYVTASGPTSSPRTVYTITVLGKEAMRAAEVAAAQNGSLGEKMREMKARMNGNGN
jgi:hypothetical protein